MVHGSDLDRFRWWMDGWIGRLDWITWDLTRVFFFHLYGRSIWVITDFVMPIIIANSQSWAISVRSQNHIEWDGSFFLLNRPWLICNTGIKLDAEIRNEIESTFLSMLFRWLDASGFDRSINRMFDILFAPFAIEYMWYIKLQLQKDIDNFPWWRGFAYAFPLRNSTFTHRTFSTVSDGILRTFIKQSSSGRICWY